MTPEATQVNKNTYGRIRRGNKTFNLVMSMYARIYRSSWRAIRVP